ncbi:MBL fold metallo-hydrolase [Wenzhouxiangella sp. AB-CW3]|uniref:MBL fold metallo-hydrolase n=1 Tax=Wenzhouxiangella sp. AB-CW3 TaxID=2771012 RepID=UPI00168A9804|nr:MBL fold metallo-hydrolase [Wenzhouxiangella sp. AB-CW3]QOC24040.1 MBL fold metallo-hydrolase [Wenzhouxiangella sp. AB-CW3]
MRQVRPDLWETESFSPFKGLKTHAYLLTRPDGNVLFYNTGHADELDHIARLGGVSWQYLSHEDELGDTLNTIAERFGSKLIGHRAERESWSKVRAPDEVFDQRGIHLGNIEVIPTPGHSPGSTCFLVASPTGKSYLFTGDTLFLGSDNHWRAGFIGGVHEEEDKAVLAESLKLLRTLNPDLVFGSAYTGDEGFEDVSDGSWPDKVDAALRTLKDL